MIETATLEELEREAVRFAREAGGILLEHFRRPLNVEYKAAGRRDPVTEVDRRTETYLREVIGRAYPDHGIVGEESANSDHATPEFAWVLDPLDGTTNFLNGFPVFASSIGILHHGRPVVAALFIPDPHGGSVYHAHLGGGAYQDDHPLSVTENPQPERGRLTGLPTYYWRLFGFRDGLRPRLGEIRSLGSTVYEMAMTARGTMQFCLFNAPWVWDVAGGILLVQEAGGDVLTRRPRSRRWEAFTSFGPTPVSLDEVRSWRGPILAGNGDLIRYTGDRTQRRSLRWLRFRRWLARRMSGRRSRRDPGEATGSRSPASQTAPRTERQPGR